jgi:hypothetical protein
MSDLSFLDSYSAEQLDELIAAAAARRGQLTPAVPLEPPRMLTGTKDPKWFLNLEGDHSALHLRDVGKGWISFLLPPRERANILSMLLHHALLAAPSASEPASAPVPPAVRH